MCPPHRSQSPAPARPAVALAVAVSSPAHTTAAAETSCKAAVVERIRGLPSLVAAVSQSPLSPCQPIALVALWCFGILAAGGLRHIFSLACSLIFLAWVAAVAFHGAGSWSRDVANITNSPRKELEIGASERAEWHRIHDRQQLQIDALVRAVDANSRLCHALLSGAPVSGLGPNHLTSTPTRRDCEASVASAEATDSSGTEAGAGAVAGAAGAVSA